MMSQFPDLDYQGILPAGRPRYPVMHDNSKSRAASMPLVPIDTIFPRRTVNAVAFDATMCNYSFVWYTGDSG